MSIDVISIILISYLIGSINFAILLSRLNKLPDPRAQGSHNPGATNMFRIAGKKVAITVFLLDAIKGVVPVWGSYYLGLTPTEIGLVALACTLGHMFPILFKFKGGKGVATALGCLLPVGLSLAAILLSIWFIVFKRWGYSSVASIVAVGLSPLFTYFIAEKYTLAVFMLATLVVIRHIPNMVRLCKGTELKSTQQIDS